MINKELDSLIREEERLSVDSMAKKLKITEKYIIEFAFENYKNQIYENKAILKEKLKAENPEHIFGQGIFDTQEVNSTEEFFDYFKKINSYYPQSCIETLCKIVPSILRDLKPHLALETEILKDFLENIPIINLFDYKIYDQNTLLEVGEQKYFVIRNYFTFDTVVTYFVCPLFINTTILFTNDRKLTEKDITNADEDFYSQDTIAKKFVEISEIFHSDRIYQSDLKEIADTNPHFNGESIENNTMGLDLYYGLKFFALFHEYSHIILNHFESQDTNFQMELEADILAINALTVNTMDYYKDSLKNNGSMIEIAAILRLISPLLHFMLKLALEPDIFSSRPTYLIRFRNAKKIIEYQMANYGLSNTSYELVGKVSTIFDKLILLKITEPHKFKEIITDEIEKLKSSVFQFIYRDIERVKNPSK